jgi:hypothetical protein
MRYWKCFIEIVSLPIAVAITLRISPFYNHLALLSPGLMLYRKRTKEQTELQIKEYAKEVNVLSWVWILHKTTSPLFQFIATRFVLLLRKSA